MRFVRYQAGKEVPRYGWVRENKVGPVEGSIFGRHSRGETSIPLETVCLRAPVEPGKIICIGRNYVEHAKEHNAEVPKLPLIFLKPPSSIIGPGDRIVLTAQSQQIEHEGELVIVIGKRGRNIAAPDARDYIFGFTIGNDVTARDLQRSDGQWTRAKGFDTFCPLGPWIDTEFTPSDSVITCDVSGQERQRGAIRDMVFGPAALVSFVSSIMTLEPGDVILTGTPSGVGPLKDGDIVEVEVSGLGRLSNPVSAQA